MTENPSDKTGLSKRIDEVIKNVALAAKSCGRSPADITVLAATKARSPEVINEAISLGIKHIGENRVQELLDKYVLIDRRGVTVHFIGHLQTNKVKYIVDKVDMIHSVDRLSLACEIDKRCAAIGKRMDVLIEVNIGGEKNKSGIKPTEAEAFAVGISRLRNIRVRGLMAIPPIAEYEEEAIGYFDSLRQLFIDIYDKKIDNIHMDILSMGMSEDYPTAIRCGANLIRLGTAIFGPR